MREEVPPIFVMATGCLPQLQADWVVIQPEVVRADPTRGWEPVDRFGLYLGRDENVSIDLGSDCSTSLCRVIGRGSEAVEVLNLADEPLYLVSRQMQTE